MPRVVHFEIHASKPQQLVDFYTEVFGWKFTHRADMQYWMIDSGEGPGINGGLLQRHGPKPEPGTPVSTHCTVIDVPDIDAYLKRAIGAGAKEALPKMAIPGIGFAAYILDPDNNVVGLFQGDHSAK